MKTKIFIAIALYAATSFPPLGGMKGGCQNIAISTDGSAAETGVMLDIKVPGTNTKATTAAVQTFFQIHSFDATTDALKLRLGFKTDATAGNRYGFIDFPEYIAGVPTYRNLSLQPSGGNVGIGTSAPFAKLEISQSVIGTIAQLSFLQDNATIGNKQNIIFRGRSLGNDNFTFAQISGDVSSVTDAANTAVAGHLEFFTATGGTLSERMRIESGGNVGIGTTSPTELLDVNGNLRISDVNSSAEEKILAQWNYDFNGPGHGTVFETIQSNSETAVIAKPSGTGIGSWFVALEDASKSHIGAIGMDGSRYVIRADNKGGASSPGKPIAFEVDLGSGGGLTEVMRITANITGSNVGIGTSTPGFPMEISRTATGLQQILALYNPASEAGGNGVGIGFYGDGVKKHTATIMAEQGNGFAHLIFSTRESDPLGVTEKMRITSSGNVGIGTTIPSEKLEVCGNLKVIGTINASGVINASQAITCSSDKRYKKDITPLPNALNSIMQLQGVNYFWKTKEFPDKQFTGTKQIGFIAQEIEKIYPEVVMMDKDGYKSVDYSRLTPILVEAIKEQQKIINELKKQNEEQSQNVQLLKEEFKKIKSIVSSQVSK